ncbi:hypothetical protein GW17_00005753 [Ensete ventricosum]|uniref:Uncharacterized protein n=1 Tax=Ensete ventricosum TaxID=4639 RepID=A0A426ZV97_ENSVE|nr:hypothetical protein B296_00037525 [Ensete ventricosum]RWW29714.1 hypothetical protein GW17_00005753 [Ensete ventricosum]
MPSLKPSKLYIEEKWQEFLNEFRRSLVGSPIKSQLGKSSNTKESRSEKCDHGQDTGYSHMKVEFPRWEDRDPINWISHAKKFFRFHRVS